MHIISFDSATKSLAVSITYYNIDMANDIKKEYDAYILKRNYIINSITSCPSDTATKINSVLRLYASLLDHVIQLRNNKIKIKMLSVVDLIPSIKISDTDTVYRTNALHDYLNQRLDPIIQMYEPNDCVFLLEYQMGPNVKSGTISSQIMYHLMKYRSDVGDNIKLVGPSLKNKIVIGGEGSKYAAFIEKYTTNYACNKAHAKHNFYKLLEYLGEKDLIIDINKKIMTILPIRY